MKIAKSINSNMSYTGVFNNAFGMQLPNRHESVGDSYRYGFQNQEVDSEVKGEGNSVNYEYRMHDPRLGRFFAVDPLTKKYPYLTPYQFSSNQPIHACELEGLESANELNSHDPAYRSMSTEGKKSYHSAQNTVFVGALVVATDFFITRGWLSRAYFLHELGSELNATDRYHEAKANGNEQEAAKQKENMEAHGLGSTLGAAAEVLPFVIPKGASLLTRVDIRKSLASKYMRSNQMKYVDFTKEVFTKTIGKGTELVQFRVKGNEGTMGNYFAPVGTKPAQIGIDPNDVVETLTIVVKQDTKVLSSTHTTNAPYYANESIVLEGGGTQYFSTKLKDNVTVKP